MKNCGKCENYFSKPVPGSECEKCIMVKWGSGFKRASIPTRIRILRKRLRSILVR